MTAIATPPDIDNGWRRKLDWERSGCRPMKPMVLCRKTDISPIGFLGPDLEYHVEVALKNLDHRFVVLYDRFTASDATAPGHHLYRECSGGVIQLEMSFQEDMSRPWPQGTPKTPGPWIIAEVAKRLKKRLPGASEDAIDKDCWGDTKASVEASEAERARKADDELTGELEPMAHTLAKAFNGDSESVGLRKKKDPTGRPITAYAGQTKRRKVAQ